MRITFRDPLVQHTAPEDSAFTLTIKFWDDAAEPWTAYTPSSIKYRIDCLSSGAQLTDWTSVSAASSVAQVIPASAQSIQRETNWRERRKVTVMANDGLSTQYQGAFDYYVENNKAI